MLAAQHVQWVACHFNTFHTTSNRHSQYFGQVTQQRCKKCHQCVLAHVSFRPRAPEVVGIAAIALLRLAPIMLIGLARCTYKFCWCHETEQLQPLWPWPPKHHQVEAKLLEQRKPFVPFHKHWWQHCNWSHLLCLALSCRQTEPVSASIVELLWKVKKKNVSHLLRRLPLMNLLNVQDF